MIKEYTCETKWLYICSKDNPSDPIHIGIEVSNEETTHQWFHGRHFLWKPDAE